MGNSEARADSYRTLWLLSMVGMLFQQLLLDRLWRELNKLHGIYSNQFGFRPGYTAIKLVSGQDSQQKTQCRVFLFVKRPYNDHKMLAVILLDITIGVNFASWEKLLK